MANPTISQIKITNNSTNGSTTYDVSDKTARDGLTGKVNTADMSVWTEEQLQNIVDAHWT